MRPGEDGAHRLIEGGLVGDGRVVEWSDPRQPDMAELVAPEQPCLAFWRRPLALVRPEHAPRTGNGHTGVQGAQVGLHHAGRRHGHNGRKGRPQDGVTGELSGVSKARGV